MEERGLGASADNPRIAERAALMTRATKRDIDRDELGGVWQRQAADLGLDAGALVAGAVERFGPVEREPVSGLDRGSAPTVPELSGIGNARRWDRRRDARTGRRSGAGAGEDGRAPEREVGTETIPPSPASEAVAWAMAHLSEREAVFLAHRPVRRRAHPCAGRGRDGRWWSGKSRH